MVSSNLTPTPEYQSFLGYTANMSDSKLFQVIPGVGESISRDMLGLGFSNLAELASADPEQMYRDLAELRGQKIDPCVLYVFRCAVYFASHEKHDPELLKWRNWKGMHSG